MIFITSIYFPPDRSVEMKDILMTLQPKPDYMTVRGPYFHGEGEKGIKSMTIYEFASDRESDAYRFIMNHRIKPYFKVSGFKFTCDMWLETLEGFQLIDVD